MRQIVLKIKKVNDAILIVDIIGTHKCVKALQYWNMYEILSFSHFRDVKDFDVWLSFDFENALVWFKSIE